MCTAAYREALTRDFSSTPSPSPSPAPALSQRQAAEAVGEGAAAESGRAMTLVKDATVVNGEAIDRR
jgi:hypothetical protein